MFDTNDDVSKAKREKMHEEGVEIQRLRIPNDVLKFIKLQWKFYEHDPLWVPPLLIEQKKILDPRRYPFYQHAEIQLFFARKGGEIVGRIAAITNELHNQIHNDNVGFFGFFESVNDQAVANALITAAKEWLQQRGKDRIRGPVNPSMNDTCGLLVEDFRYPPVVLMPYNPPYYAQLLEAAGLQKVMDLYAYLLEKEQVMNERLIRFQSLIRQRYHITVRAMNFKNKRQFRKDIEVIRSIYNRAWEPNWGFVKLTDNEFDAIAKDLKQIADPDFVLIAEAKGEPCGCVVALPNINEALIANRSGRLLPGIWHLLTKRRKIKMIRILILGLLPAFQGKGIDAVLYYEVAERGIAKGYTSAEASWILENNAPMNVALEKTLRARRYKVYRMYEAPIEK